MRKYQISATVRGDEDDLDSAGKPKVYGTEIEVEGPDSIDEFITADGQSGVLDTLVTNFRQNQAAILRGKIAAKIGKEKDTGGGRLANAVRVDV